MNLQNPKYLISLCEDAGFDIKTDMTQKRRENIYSVEAEGYNFPLAHPFQIHLTLYKRLQDSTRKFHHFKAAHDLLWPKFAETWNEWDEIKFRAHCEGYHHVVCAGGANISKSHGVARIAILFFLSAPTHNAVLVCSTTLESLESRIWGYVTKFISEAKLPVEAVVLRSKPPKVLHPQAPDKIHGMFALAVRLGEEERTLSTFVGRHPDHGLMLILDEAPYMSPNILATIPNLEKGLEVFQLWALGNSDSKNDLHGSLATPKVGWPNVSPDKHCVWETKHPGGIVLYFNPYKSPAITMQDCERKKKLAKFLPTKETLKAEEEKYGKLSDAFWKFTLGFWRTNTASENLISHLYLLEHRCMEGAEWSGQYPLTIVAGLDPAFARDSDTCILRMAYVGHDVNNNIVIDFGGEKGLTYLQVPVGNFNESPELLLCREIITELNKRHCPLSNLCLDASGLGRTLGELLRLHSGQTISPLSIMSVMRGDTMKPAKDNPNMYVGSPITMWQNFHGFIQYNQIKGLDSTTGYQLSMRLTKFDKTGNTMLESKIEYKSRMSTIMPSMAQSPGEVDATILALHMAIIRFGFRPGQKRGEDSTTENKITMEKIRSYFAEQDLINNAANQNNQLAPSFHNSLESAANLLARFSNTRLRN